MGWPPDLAAAPRPGPLDNRVLRPELSRGYSSASVVAAVNCAREAGAELANHGVGTARPASGQPTAACKSIGH